MNEVEMSGRPNYSSCSNVIISTPGSSSLIKTAIKYERLKYCCIMFLIRCLDVLAVHIYMSKGTNEYSVHIRVHTFLTFNQASVESDDICEKGNFEC